MVIAQEYKMPENISNLKVILIVYSNKQCCPPLDIHFPMS